MKKLLSVLAVLCLLFGAAGNAAADFTYGAVSSLGLSIYNEDTNVETGYDLGVGLDLSQQDLTLLSGVNVSDTDATVALYSTTNAYQSFFGITQDTTTGISSSTIINFNGTVRDIWLVGYLTGTSPVSVAASGPKTASTLFGTSGNYAGLVSGGNPLLQPNLNDLATDSFVDIYLYQYDALTINTGFDPTTDYAAIIRIADNGDVILNPNAVPVPGALVLICTGLLGALGIKRRNV